MKSTEETVSAYIASLPENRAAVISEMRDFVNKHIKAGFEETMRWGMISWEIPLSRYPITYNKAPLNYAGLAAQKNSNSLYLMSCYLKSEDSQTFEKKYLASGKKLDMGKACIRFKSISALHLPLIATYVRRFSVAQYISEFERSRA